jgi:hypothetical protein
MLLRVVFRSNAYITRNEGAFIMASIIPILILSFMGGDNFSMTPINLKIGSIFAGIFIIRKTFSISNKGKNVIHTASKLDLITMNQNISKEGFTH